jgi:hypothetical protein
MNATTYGDMLKRLNAWIDKGDYKADDIVLWDLWSEEDYINLTEENVKVPWVEVAEQIDRKSDWLNEELSQFIVETADYIDDLKKDMPA